MNTMQKVLKGKKMAKKERDKWHTQFNQRRAKERQQRGSLLFPGITK
jgi:hypothetical protein